MTQNDPHPANTHIAPQTTDQSAGGPGNGPLDADAFRAVIAQFPEYRSAQAVVDQLSDSGFEVGTVRIVGHGLKSVEQVTGRMTYGRAAGYGALSGAWFGLLIGLLLSIFLIGVFWGPIIWSIVIGAVWGLIFGLLGFAATGNARNFRSANTMTAEQYTVEVPRERASQALQILSQAGTVQNR